MNNANDFILGKEDINKMLSKIADMVTEAQIQEGRRTRGRG